MDDDGRRRIGLSTSEDLRENRRTVRRVAPAGAPGERSWIGLPGSSLQALFARVSRLAGAAAIAGCLLVLGRLAYRFVHTSPRFALRAIEIQGIERISRDEALAAAGIRMGENVFGIEPAQVERRLGGLAWTRESHAERHLPGLVRIRIVERRAAALVQLGPLYLVDEDGTVFKRYVHGDPVDLPVLTGIDREAFERDRSQATAGVREMLGLLADYERAGLSGVEPISEIHREPDGGLTILAARDGAEYRLGRPPWGVRIRQLAGTLAELGRRGVRAEYIYLDGRVLADRAVVKIADSPPVPGRAPTGSP